MKNPIREMHNLGYRRFLITKNSIQLQEGFFKRTITTPQVMTKFYPSTITYIELNKPGKNQPKIYTWISRDTQYGPSTMGKVNHSRLMELY